jgi:hypothetical protein
LIDRVSSLPIFRRNHQLAWATFMAGAVVLGTSVFTWGDAALWYRFSLSDLSTRQRDLQAPLGDKVFKFSIPPQTPSPRLVQIIPTPIVENLHGEQVTLGAWIWASKPAKVRTPILDTQTQTF